MPSVLIDNAFSGGSPLFSGNPFSGRSTLINAETWIKADNANSGRVFVGLSGGFTVNSGSFPLSGGGLSDGWPLSPGQEIKIPPLRAVSGANRIFLKCEAAASGGFGRVHYLLF